MSNKTWDDIDWDRVDEDYLWQKMEREKKLDYLAEKNQDMGLYDEPLLLKDLDVDYSDDEWPDSIDDMGNFYDPFEDEEINVNMKYMSPEFYDFLTVVEFGARKHDKPGGDANWASPNGSKSSHKDMHASMFRHLAESSSGVREDKETGIDPLLHLATRALMMYTRIKRGLIHEEDT